MEKSRFFSPLSFILAFQMAHHWDPIRDLFALQERMNRLFEDATARRAREDSESDIGRVDWTPSADVYNRDAEYVVMVDLPGIDRDSLDISIEDNRLWIRGKRVVEENAQQRLERSHGNFVKKFGPLPASIDHEVVKASYVDGVLKVTLPKRATEKPTRVAIKVD